MPTTSLPPEIIEAQRQLNVWYEEWPREAIDTMTPTPGQIHSISRGRTRPRREYATTSAQKRAERTTKDEYDLD